MPPMRQHTAMQALLWRLYRLGALEGVPLRPGGVDR